jgi:hypothetical protein
LSYGLISRSAQGMKMMLRTDKICHHMTQRKRDV